MSRKNARTGARQACPAQEGSEELYLMCDDLTAAIQALECKGVNCSSVEEARWGSVTRIELPGGGTIGRPRVFAPR